MEIVSDLVIVNKPARQVFDFLCNFNNYEKLMPEQVIKWESDDTSGRFTIKDMAEIGMRIKDARPDGSVLLCSDGKVPFEFTLRVDLEEREGKESAVQIFFEGEISAFLAMMARRPLTNLVNHMAERIRQLHE
jgi:carbon monoxide dehydrogenase subunit G